MFIKTKPQTRLKPVVPGKFGGIGVGFAVEKKGVKIDFDCGDGEISEQLKMDKKGNFKATGTYTGGTFGPVRLGHEPKPQPALYEGKITGDVMKFKVTLTDTNELIGEYTVTRGKGSKIHRCY